MIDGELRPIVIEFIVEMLNDPHCESVLLDTGEDAIVGSDVPVLYLGVTGKRYGCILSVVGGEYSVSIRDVDMDETIATVKGRGMGASGAARRNQDKTMGGQMIKLFDWEFLKHSLRCARITPVGAGMICSVWK